jgi:hypothetical protein
MVVGLRHRLADRGQHRLSRDALARSLTRRIVAAIERFAPAG